MNYSDTYQIEILKEGEFARRHFVILSIGYYPCAYVEFFDEIDEDSLKWENVPCHYDVTYQGTAYWNEELRIIKKDNRYYIGWDYGHKYDWVGYKTDEENTVEGKYIVVNEEGLIIDQDGEVFPFILGDYVYNDWEILEEPKKVKLRDLTEEQYKRWVDQNCMKLGDDSCRRCPFKRVRCDNDEDRNDWWIRNKDLYSDKFLDREIEIEIEED